ncbi:MAG TPA: glutamate synthase large subunit [Bacteroidetes bacterium]|nr:glutamate synthase large subunit [Bacteroidota bacterium]
MKHKEYFINRPEKTGLYHPDREHDSCGIGFVAHIRGKPSHEIIARGLEVLVNMRHRGAESADNKTGDGAGILIQIPHSFFLAENFPVTEPGTYGTGLVFLPVRKEEQNRILKLMKETAEEEGLGWMFLRDVPVDNRSLGEIARRSEPAIRQVFLRADMEQDELERKLYVFRKRMEKKVRESSLSGKEVFYICSLSTRVMIYKGMFTPEQLQAYYPDLSNPSMESAIALVHSRFSTNTFPSWDLAQPFRMLAHNGEINTIRGNRLWMHAREALLKSELFGDDLEKLFPVIEPGKSDSASLDNVLEFLTMTGRTLPHALTMLVPESFNDKNPIPPSLKAYYEYHSTFMEPWDGPAALLFSDGRYVGGTLDRNGLRPARYLVTEDDLIVMGSETGVQEFDGGRIVARGRLHPGKILLVDTRLGIIIPDEEVKMQLARRNPYVNWLKENRLALENIEVQQRVSSGLGEEYPFLLKAFGYSKEDLRYVMIPMALEGKEPVSSMGNDTPLAVLSDKPQRLFNYFRQVFAQVTNPPIDPIREELVMSLTSYIGSVQKNLLEETPGHCRLIRFDSPVITNTDLGKIKDMRHESFSHAIIDMVFEKNSGQRGLEKALERITLEAEKAVDNQKNFIILSDRKTNRDQVPVPSLLAVAAVHHYLIEHKKRMQVGLIVETGEAREVMHYALLIGYGASVINPYLSFAVLSDLVKKGEIGLPYSRARENYIRAVNKGILKILSKMGISTLLSYMGSQLFEAVGLSEEIAGRYFTGTPSRIGGIGLREIAAEAEAFHRDACTDDSWQPVFTTRGIYSYRRGGEFHAWNPETIAWLQSATAQNDPGKFREYTRLADSETCRPAFLRGMLDYRKNPIPVGEVEPAESIMKRFVTGAMSFGSISREAHEALAIAMNAIGGRSNSGEGGEDPNRYLPGANGEVRRSAIKQVASGRFGVDIFYLNHADEIQIKIAQGAKPGEGGQLPGHKVDRNVARIRRSVPGITLISPPPHHDIYSIEDLAQLIYDLKCANPAARISVKLVSENGVGTVAVGVAKAHADLIVISGGEGGTGASPLSSVRYAGLPMELGLAETHQTLVMNGLRERVKIQVDGQLKTGRDLVIAGLLGAEEFGLSTACLITLGCVMMRKCHQNTCPAGIATQNRELRKRFTGKSEYVVHFFRFLAEDVREHLAAMGFRQFDDMVGRRDLLTVRKGWNHPKVRLVDLSGLLHYDKQAKNRSHRKVMEQHHPIDGIMDDDLIRTAEKALVKKEKIWIARKIRNTDRAVGAKLSGALIRQHGLNGLPDDTIHCNFYGSAGQSFGAFLAQGITFRLEGDANDYLGKGLSGGRIVVVPPANARFRAENSIIIGNTILYGATRGWLFVNGIAGERFCVRNSGAYAVAEGTGDHGCEYMTGGRVVILGKIGRNFAAGMSGGIAYVLDEEKKLRELCNHDLVELSHITDYDDVKELQSIISTHWQVTHSARAERILTRWDEYLPVFVKVFPLEYKKVLNEAKLREINLKLQKAAYDPDFAE